jgi:malonyl-CoA O-methyltransferase
MSFLSVRDAYDRWSAFYDAYDNPMVYMASQALEAGLATRVSGKALFEFGCGTGRNLATLRNAGAGRVTGCDLSPGMLAIANPISSDVFVHDMSEPLPIDSGQFDVVLFTLTLEHLENLELPLREAARIIRENGSIHLYEIHPFLSLSGVAAHFQDGEEEVRMPAYPHQFADYLRAFASAGLFVTECREWRPADLGTPAPLKAMKRGPDFPMLVEFSLRQAAAART